MSLIASSGGVNRIPKSWYGASGGVNRKLQSIYGAVQGANRKLFSAAVTWAFTYFNDEDANNFHISAMDIGFSGRGSNAIRSILYATFSNPIYITSIDVMLTPIFYFSASHNLYVDGQFCDVSTTATTHITVEKEVSKFTVDCEYEGTGRVEGEDYKILIHSHDYGDFYLDNSQTSEQ